MASEPCARELVRDMLRDGFAFDTIGIFEPFPVIARTKLASRGLDSDVIEHVLSGFASLDTHPAAALAMRALHEGDVCVCALTNGSAQVTEFDVRAKWPARSRERSR